MIALLKRRSPRLVFLGLFFVCLFGLFGPAHSSYAKPAPGSMCFKAIYDKTSMGTGTTSTQVFSNNYCITADKSGKITGTRFARNSESNSQQFFTIKYPSCENGKRCALFLSSVGNKTPIGKRQIQDVQWSNFITRLSDSFTKNGSGADSAGNRYKFVKLEASKVDKNGKIVATNEYAAAGENKTDPCYDMSGSVSWIFCPIINMAETAFNTLYEHFIEPLLQTRSAIFAQDNGTYQAWSNFRNIANIAFVIAILVVILSQVSGIGISNYGIKKLLPKIIITAILVNLSYIICQLAVDASNIIGNSITDFLVSLSPEIDGSETTEHSTAAKIAALLGTFAVGGTALIAVLATQGGTLLGVVIIVLCAVLAALLAFLFLVFVLVARQVGIVLMVVLAPLAVVAYMLPGTSGLFKKYISIAKSLILVYPLCGAVIGGGALAGAILYNVGAGHGGTSASVISELFKVAAMLATTLPYLLIPMLLKNSLSAMGNLGAKLSKLGTNLSKATSGRTRKAWQGSEAFKEATLRRKAGKPGGLRERFAQSSLGKRTGAYDRMARNRLSYGSMIEKRGALSTAFEGDYRDMAEKRANIASEAALGKIYEDQFGDMKSGQVQAAFREAVNSHDAVKAAAAARTLIKTSSTPLLHEALRDTSVEDLNTRAALSSELIKTSDPELKLWAKEYLKQQNSATLAKDYANGNISHNFTQFEASGAFASLAGKGGEAAFDGADKDAWDNIISSNYFSAAPNSSMFANNPEAAAARSAILRNGAISTTGETLSKVNEAIHKFTDSGGSMAGAFNVEQLSKVQLSTLQQIPNAHVVFRDEMQKLKQDKILWNKTAQDVQNYINTHVP